MDFIKTHYKKIGIGIVAAAALVAIVLTIIDFMRNANLIIAVAPTDSVITINGKRYSNGAFRFFPGEISVKIEHDGLDVQEFKLKLESNTTTPLYKYLTKDGKFDYYEKNNKDYVVLRLIADDAAKNYIQENERKLQFASYLPINTTKVGGAEAVIGNASERPDCERIVCLYTFSNTGSDALAEELIETYGFKLSDFQIYHDEHDYPVYVK